MGLTENYPDIGKKPTKTLPDFSRLFGGGLQHLSAREIEANYHSVWQQRNFAFSVIRHPVARFVSHFLWKYHRFSDNPAANADMLKRFLSYFEEFEDLARSLDIFKNPFEGMQYCEGSANSVHLNSEVRHVIPQCSMLFSSGVTNIEYIYLLENLRELGIFLKRQNILVQAMQHRMVGMANKSLLELMPETKRYLTPFVKSIGMTYACFKK